VASVPKEEARGRAPWWAQPLVYAHDLLDVSEPVRPADAVVVFAGMRERKPYGLELWREGLAPALVLSVGRFEWRGIPELLLPSDGGLRALVDQTPPWRRHFLITIDGLGARAEWIPRGRFGTWSEARAIAALARARNWRSLLLVTTAAHSRRALLSLDRALRASRGSVRAIAVPEERSSVRRSSWWRSRAGRSLVIGEWIKLPVYALLCR
jgi:uncharacterized SAM-binding protein YcdF (DUF218 family)